MNRPDFSEIISTATINEVGAWCERISARWQSSVEGIIACGKMLSEARAAVGHGGWQYMFSEANTGRLPFGDRAAQMLMAVGGHVLLSNPNHGSVLPNSWRALYDLSRLPESVLRSALAEGRVRPDMERKHVRRLLPLERARAAQPGYEMARDYCTVHDLAALILTGERFGTILADPPWMYGNQATRASTGDHYIGMPVDEICAMRISDLAAANAHLHIWTTNAFLFEARRVMESWGFEYKSCFVWVKPQMGMGNYWRVSHEFLLLGVRGRAPFLDRSLMSWASYPRRDHSAKPEEIRRFIESAGEGPRLELFARRKAPGWTSWGNEIERDVFDGTLEVA